MNLSTKQNNRKAVLNYIKDKSEISIAEISLETKISKPTIQKILNYYEEQNLVVIAGKGNSTEEGGKKPLLYMFNKNFATILNVHIGPSFVYGAIANMRAELVHTVNLERPNDHQENSFQMVVSILKDFLSHDLVRQSPAVAIVIAMPGIIDSINGISVYSPHYPNWAQQFPLRDYIHESLSVDIPIYVDCVNRYQALEEYQNGKARNIRTFVMIDAMDEGVGAGIFVDNQIRSGYQHFAGEVGHMVLQPFDGPECICGGRGCFESLVSVKNMRRLMAGDKALARQFQGLSDMPDAQLMDILFGGGRENNEACLDVLDQLAFWFASGFNNIMMVNDPELIILEGIYKDAGSLFLEMILKHIDKMSFINVKKQTKIEFSSFGPERGIAGAAVFGVQNYFMQLFQS
jgi:N-acetylglucosamine repressor